MTHADAVSTLATERYLLDEMKESERDAFETHYFECPDCAKDVTDASAMREEVKTGVLRHAAGSKVIRPAFATVAAPVQAPPRPVTRTRPWYQTASLPWAVAATLAVVVGYQSSTGPDTRDQATLVALSPTLLRPASRGAVPVVSGAGGHVALALDVDGSDATELAYALKSADGRTLVSSTATAPATGSPLVLVIPTFTLTPQQTYTLSVRDARRSAPLGEFTFMMGASR